MQGGRLPLDGGASWENLGLDKTEHIGNIVVHPKHSNTEYVASQGPLWSAGGENLNPVASTPAGPAPPSSVYGPGKDTAMAICGDPYSKLR